MRNLLNPDLLTLPQQPMPFPDSALHISSLRHTLTPPFKNYAGCPNWQHPLWLLTFHGAGATPRVCSLPATACRLGARTSPELQGMGRMQPAGPAPAPAPAPRAAPRPGTLPSPFRRSPAPRGEPVAAPAGALTLGIGSAGATRTNGAASARAAPAPPLPASPGFRPHRLVIRAEHTD